MPDTASSSGMQPRHSLSKTSVPGCYGDLRDRIVPASYPSLCDVAQSADCLSSQLYKRHNSAYVKAVITDSLASGPFEDFLVKRNSSKARLLLNFWRDAQVHS